MEVLLVILRDDHKFCVIGNRLIVVIFIESFPSDHFLLKRPLQLLYLRQWNLTTLKSQMRDQITIFETNCFISPVPYYYSIALATVFTTLTTAFTTLSPPSPPMLPSSPSCHRLHHLCHDCHHLHHSCHCLHHHQTMCLVYGRKWKVRMCSLDSNKLERAARIGVCVYVCVLVRTCACVSLCKVWPVKVWW